MEYFEKASEEHQKREKAKAYELKKSQWWKQQAGPGVCYYCQKKVSPKLITMDHVIPISRGGKSTKKNCVPCCKDCNSSKSHKTSFEITLEEMKRALK